MNTLAYIDLAKRLREKVPGIKHIDLYNQQPENPQLHIPQNLPAVLIEFLPTQWQTQGQGTQRGTGGIRVYCVMKNFLGADNIDRHTQQAAEQRLAYLLFEKVVHAALQDFAPSGYGKLMRSSTLPDATFTSVMVVVHEYEAAEADDSAFVYKDYEAAVIEAVKVKEMEE
jgi:hypothetical protein